MSLPTFENDHEEKIWKAVNECKNNNEPKKIFCASRYERMLAHKYAGELGLKSRSIIDYTEVTAHCYKKMFYEKDVFYDVNYDGEVCNFKVWLAPVSYVEINNGYKKETIGTEDLIPDPIYSVSIDINQKYIENEKKIKILDIHKQRVDKFLGFVQAKENNLRVY